MVTKKLKEAQKELNHDSHKKRNNKLMQIQSVQSVKSVVSFLLFSHAKARKRKEKHGVRFTLYLVKILLCFSFVSIKTMIIM